MHDDSPTNDDILFDRLVDGELSDDERRRLIASLDDRPDGWRQCALAFLEAQSWRRQFTQVVRPAPIAATAASGTTRRSPAQRHWGLAWALAASVLLAFTLGLALRDYLLFPLQSPGPGSGTQLAATDAPQFAEASPTDDDSIDVVTFWVRDEEGRAQPMLVPLVDAQTFDSQLGTEFQSSLSADARDHLQGEGYAVQSNRRYAPFRLDDGRSMVVPVEDTRIVPIAQRVY